MQRLHQIRLAMMMLTRLPMGHLPEPAPTLGASAWAFPLVGIVTGSLAWAVLQGALALGASTTIAALLALAALAWATGALHEDGLADCADGLGGGRDRAHCLDIMRDSRIGSYGVVALVLVLGLKAATLSELGAQATLLLMVHVGVTSRLMMLGGLVRLPPARDTGLGRNASGVPRAAVLPGVVVALTCTALLGGAGVVALACMGLASVALAAIAQRRIQGQTGDVLGAVQTISEAVGLTAFSVLLQA